MDKVNILNTSINNISTDELLEKLSTKGGIVFTPNVDHIMKLQNDREFYEAYNQADYRICDGQILKWSLNFLGIPIKEKISGSDLLPAFYHYNKQNPNIKIFLLGGAQGVPQKAKEKINQKFFREIVVAAHSPSFGFEENEQECLEIINIIARSEATVLVVGLGAPKQEKWIIKYKNKFSKIKIFLAVGAAIDFEAGRKKRAPKWMSEVGLETPYRLISEPKRLWRRYLVEDPPFLLLMLKQKLKIYKNPFY
jgi:N-acetylglucosaminyldiphosphoundecaprenol N-acetyl-beta-D-mannosaminyltransferase